MKSVFKFFALLMLFSLFVSCSGNESFTVGYLNPAENRVRFVKEGNFMAERLEQEGIETLISFAGDNDATQLEQGYEMLDKGVDLLVIAPVNGNTIAPVVREAQKRGVIVVAYNRLINNTDFDLFVTGDNADIARLFCEIPLEEQPTGNYVVFGGDRFDRNGFEVKNHIDSILKPHIESGRINLLYETFIEGWNQERAHFEFQQVVDAYGTDIDAVISCNDPMGLGVIDVLKKYDKENEVIVTGQDALLDAVRSIYRDEMFMTIYHPHKELGYKTGELIVQILEKGTKPDEISNAETFNGASQIPTVRMKSMAITKDNLEQLVENGEYTWDQIRN